MKVLSFGEILWDVYSDEKYIGGAPFNFAAHMAKHGEKTYMLSAVGNDDLGKNALEKLNEFGVSAEYVSVLDDKQTGKCLVTLDEQSVPTYNLLQNVAYDFINVENVPNDFDVLYFGTLSLRDEHNYNALKQLIEKNHFSEIFADVNIRPPFYSKKSVCFALENATVLKISLEEMENVSDLLKIKCQDYKEFAKNISDIFKNLKYIIVTLGADGAYTLECADQKEYSCGGKKVNVKSTVGAGDSFSAAFLHKYFSGGDICFCMEYAAEVAGYVVSCCEAVPNYKIADFD